MKKKSGIFVDCIKPLFNGYYGYLFKEKDNLAYIKRTNNLTQLINQYLLSEVSNSQYYEGLLNTSNDLSKTAKLYFDENFDTFHKSSLVNLYSGFELAIEEFIVNIFRAYDDSIPKIDFIANLPKVKTLSPPNNHEEAKKILKTAISVLYKKEIRGVRAYFAIFKCLEMDIKISELHIKKFEELKQVRNCIVHNGSVIDTKSILNAPSLSEFKGVKYIIDENIYELYYQSISQIHSSITGAMSM